MLFTSLSAILIRLATAPPIIVAAYRMVFSTLLLIPWFVTDLRKQQSKMTLSDFGACLLSGVFLAVHFASWITSLSYTTVASATVLVNTQPVFLAIAGAVLLRERISLGEAVAILTAMGGSALLAFGDAGAGGAETQGDLLALLGAVSVAGYMLVGRVVRARVGLIWYTVIVYGTAGVLLTLFAAVLQLPFGGYPATDYLLFLAMAVFCTLLGHSLMNWSLRYLDATFIGTAFLGEPVLASGMALVIFAEVPTTTTVAGGIVILISLYAYTRFEASRTKQRNRSEDTR